MKFTYVKKQHEVGNVWSYFFNANEMPAWQAGQYVNLTMPGVPHFSADRILTIASAPHQNTLQFTTLLGTSQFKQRLDTLKEGDLVEADQLGGDFTYEIPSYASAHWPSSVRKNTKRLFIAGGIGVTPYLSIIRDRLYKGRPINATLLYAGKDDKRPFMKELAAASVKDQTFSMRTYSDTRLTLAQLMHDMPDIESYVVYLAGSQKFSEDLGEGLVAAGFPRTQIKYDYFDGYVDIEY